MDAKARATFRVLDVTHNGGLSPRTYPQSFPLPPWPPSLPLPTSLFLRLVFIAGELGRDELNKRLSDAGITDEEFEQLFSRLDTNQDGKVRA